MNPFKKSIPFLLSLLSIAALASCSSEKKPSEAKLQHQAWLESLNDSIAALRDSVDLCNDQILELQKSVAQQLEKFTYVNDPRQVEGYTILKGWEKRYPLTATGIVARMTESEDLEIVCALSGANFSQISVTADGNTTNSAVVPHDQALNYRAGGLNTVAFSGPEADIIAAAVSNAHGDVTLTFLNPGNVKSVKLSAEQKDMLSNTWRLISNHRDANRLESRLPILNEKIKIYEQRLARQ